MKTIDEQVGEMHVVMATQAPAEALNAFAAEQSGLDAQGIPAGVLKVGANAPDAQLLTENSEALTFHEALGGKPTVVIFYRGAWCPYCNITLKTYQEDLVPLLAGRNVNLIAISTQKPDGQKAMSEKHTLTFKVYSDAEGKLVEAFGIGTNPIEDVAAVHDQFGFEVPASNVSGTNRMAIPTTVIIDTDGVIKFIDVHPNYTTRTEVSIIDAALTGLGI
jgi:peroxiredoxin